ncbi:hypothetical protein Tco_0127269 [Tanacetum coccineum]
MMVIIVAVVVVMVIWVVIFVDVIVGVVIVVAIIRVVVFVTIIGIVIVVGGVPSIIKLSFMIIGFLRPLVCELCWWLLPESEVLKQVLLGLSVFAMTAVYASRAAVKSAIRCSDRHLKLWLGSNSSDGGNTGDGVKIAGEVIGSGDEIEFSEELKDLHPVEAGK